MDLIETGNFRGKRHPWELARLNSVKKILAPFIDDMKGKRILDLGCGDGFISMNLFANKAADVCCVDINMPDSMQGERIQEKSRFRFLRDINELEEDKFDIILAMDVVEHVEDDCRFLSEAASRYLKNDGIFFITVPAFQKLFCEFDVYAKHYRRYSLGEITGLAKKAGLTVVNDGYLSFSALVQRTGLIVLKAFRIPVDLQKSIASWQGGQWITKLFETILTTDDSLLIFSAGAGLKLPGLTAWLVCSNSIIPKIHK